MSTSNATFIEGGTPDASASSGADIHDAVFTVAIVFNSAYLVVVILAIRHSVDRIRSPCAGARGICKSVNIKAIHHDDEVYRGTPLLGVFDAVTDAHHPQEAPMIW